MPKSKKKSTLKWDDAPDTIGVKELSEILGIGEGKTSDIFNSKGFPKIPKAGLKADKEAARLFLQGVKIPDNQKGIEYLILLELKKISKEMEVQTSA